MKNKSLLYVVTALVVLVLGGVAYSSFFSNNSKDASAKLADKKIVKIGVLQYITHPSLDEIYQGIKDGLKEEGYEEGKNIEIDFQNAEGDQSQVQTMSNLLVQNKNDIFVGIATPAAQGLANAEKEKPVIMGAISDPVGAKLVQSLEKPGANVTGVSNQEAIGDTVDLIKEITPNVKTIGILYSSNESNSKSQVEKFTSIAEKAGYTVQPYAISSTNDIISTVGVMAGKVDAIYIPVDNAIANGFESVITTANKTKTPVYSSVEDFVQKGSIAGATLSQRQLGVATGKMIAKVIKGANPADTPVDIYDKGSVVINKKAASELGLTIPDSLLKDAKVIE
ncbi:tryptophan ABC transporter substrate-binding protein [Streptococcus sp. DD13]|uniref:tryptophan ABC transporter substrate-binding protein n=1 Tax=Streptococcus sp. DD13 TaxID=1777881 RepID=UPI00082CDA70|nr:tryptophan ABC transporter substrate-binding protein [Streptococcus sp. DD13]